MLQLIVHNFHVDQIENWDIKNCMNIQLFIFTLIMYYHNY